LIPEEMLAGVNIGLNADRFDEDREGTKMTTFKRDNIDGNYTIAIEEIEVSKGDKQKEKRNRDLTKEDRKKELRRLRANLDELRESQAGPIKIN
jgi:hypothetical protein